MSEYDVKMSFYSLYVLNISLLEKTMPTMTLYKHMSRAVRKPDFAIRKNKSIDLRLWRHSSVGSDVAWNREAPRSILASGTSFREDLVIKIFLRPFFLFR